MTSHRHVIAALVIFICTSAPSCVPAPLPSDCGSFSFSQRGANTIGSLQQSQFELTFSHDGKMCKISCGNYWFVQALRPMDLDTGKFIQPHDTQQNRTVGGQADNYLNGWAIDRTDGRHLGWYGMTDDFTFEETSRPDLGIMFQLGLGPKPAMMHDTLSRREPSRWSGKRIQIVGLTAAIGLDPGTVCENKILGIQKWMVVFGHDEATNKDTVSELVQLDASQKDVQAFLGAVEEWNRNLDDGRVRLPWATSGSAFTLP